MPSEQSCRMSGADLASLEEAFIAEPDPAAAGLLSDAEGIVGRLMRG
jgi:hypothetical protein